jgi:molecular chaperone DnaK (HSP70)
LSYQKFGLLIVSDTLLDKWDTPEFSPLPKGSLVEITFSLAPDGLLSIHGKDLSTHGEIDAEFKTENILSREKLEEKKEHN